MRNFRVDLCIDANLYSQGNPPQRCHTHKGVNLMQPILDFGLSLNKEVSVAG